MILKAGEIVDGRYRLVNTVGTGGFGQVWEAQDLRLSNKLVAIKFLAPQSFDPTEELADFLREVQTLARLDHPNIIPVTDYGQTGNLFFMAMPLVQGGSVADLMDKKGPLKIDHLTFCLEQICKGLQYAHDQQVVHSDIKPANFLMRYDGHLYIADFGIARQLRQGTGSVNLSRVFGSPQHVAPEQWANRLKPQSDIYSLGVSMFEMITGEPPLKDGATSLLQGEVPTPLRRLLPNAPTALEDLINRMLHPRPEYRYPQTAAQVWVEYQSALRAPSFTAPRFNVGQPHASPHPPAGQTYNQTTGHFGNIRKPQPGTFSNLVQQAWPVVSNYAAQKLDEFAKNQAANTPLTRGQIKDRIRLIGSGVDLRGQNLSNLDLAGLDLRGASFYGASMANVNLTRAKLDGADFTAANLSGATLIKARLSNALLTNANLNGADLTKADLSRAQMVRANLTRAYMYGVDLRGTDLSEAILSEVYLADYTTSWRTKWPQGFQPPRTR